MPMKDRQSKLRVKSFQKFFTKQFFNCRCKSGQLVQLHSELSGIGFVVFFQCLDIVASAGKPTVCMPLMAHATESIENDGDE
jgi:hypothetical protein